jgi:hypothetical protein
MNDWSSIGYHLNSFDEFNDLASMVYRKGERIEFPGGFYIKLNDSSGAELWTQADDKGELCGMLPHFDCSTIMNVGVKRVLPGEGFDGSIICSAEPQLSEDSYVFVFDLPDFCAYSQSALPFVTEASVTAFAKQVRLFDSDDEFHESCFGNFARESYISSGLMHPDGKEKDPPDASAILSGIVEAFEERINSHSGRPFLWMHMKSLLGNMDVVCDPSGINKRPWMGGIMCGSFWLSGRCKVKRTVCAQG